MNITKKFKGVGHPQRHDFCNFFPFFKSKLPLKMTPQLKNKDSFRNCNFLVDFKSLIGFCLAPSQMLEPELGFWDCKSPNMGDGIIFELPCQKKNGSEKISHSP